jgi:putative ABC transport system permease protein
VGGIALTALALHIAGLGLMRVLRKVPELPWFVWRHGVGGLHRPGNQTHAVLFSVGIGALFLIAVRLNQLNVTGGYAQDFDRLDADMFLIDIQKDQRTPAEAALARLGATGLRLVPIVRERLTGLKWSPGSAGRKPRDDIRRMGGERRLTYRPTLEENETVVSGTFWPATPSTEPEISVEEDAARWFALQPGDTMIFDVAGRRMEARVTNVRRVASSSRSLSSLTRFEFVFRPGALEAAPHMFFGALKGPPPGLHRAQSQNAFMEQFPSATLVDVLDDLDEMRKRVNDLSFAISILGGLVFACGGLIMIGSIAMTKLNRLYEAAILRTLGARTKVLVQVALIGYGVLGFLAGVIGSAGSIGVTWAMTTYGRIHVPWHFQPAINAIGIVVTTVLVAVVGVLASWDVIVSKPVAILREE